MEENEMKVPEGWEEKLLGDVLIYEQPYKYAVSSTEYNDKSGTPVLTAGKSFLLGYTTETDGVYLNLPVIIFDDFTTDSKFVDFPFKVKSSAMKFLKPKDETETDLKLIYGHIQRLKIRETGGDHKRRWISEFSKLKINLPPFAEQRQIAAIFSKVDEAISQTENLIDKYSRIKTGLMQDLLTKGIDDHGKIRNEATHEFKDSPLGRVPVEWEVVKLGDIVNEGFGIIQTGPFGSQLHANEYVAEGIPVIMPQDILSDKISSLKIVKINSQKALLLKRHITEENNIVFARRGDLSKCAVIEDEFIGSICGTGCLLIRLNKSKLNPLWLTLVYQHFISQTEISITAVGSTMQNLNTGILSNLPIPRVSLSEQNQIVNILLKCNRVIDDHKSQLLKLQSLKNGLMQDLLSGKVRVNHLIQEMANV